MHKEKRWWQQILNCCPSCGSVDIRYRKSTEEWVCNRLRCGSIFKTPIISSKENRDNIRSLRKAYREQNPF